MKILIAERENSIRRVVAKHSPHVDHEFIFAQKGQEAWNLFQKKGVPDLVLLDRSMPESRFLSQKIRDNFPIFPPFLVLFQQREDPLEDALFTEADDFYLLPCFSEELCARLKQWEGRMRTSSMYRCILNAIPEPIYCKDAHFVYMICNQAFEALVGQPQSKIIGRTDVDFMRPEQIEALKAHDTQVLEKKDSIHIKEWVNLPNGERIYLSTKKIPCLKPSKTVQCLVAIGKDLTHRVQLEEELKRFEKLVEQSAESIVITDLNGTIQYVNAAFEKTSGYSASEAIGCHARMLKSGRHDPSFYTTLWETISTGKSWEGHIVNRRKNGQLYEVDAVIYPIHNNDGKIYSYVSIRRDITHEMEMERTLRQTQKMNAVGELAGGVAHDFNNILTAILGYVTLCKNVLKPNEKAFSYLGEIAKAGERASKLVRQILTFSSKEEKNFHPVDLQEVIEDSLDLVRAMAENNISIQSHLGSSEIFIFGDTTQMQQVILNLCTNAIYSMKKEKGTLSVFLQTEDLSPSRCQAINADLIPGAYASISVKDTGCGISPEFQERIFEPYFTTKSKGEGCGFGLAIVHGIVRRHQGYIEVKSELGKGTTFNLYIPLFSRTEKSDPSPQNASSAPSPTKRIS